MVGSNHLQSTGDWGVEADDPGQQWKEISSQVLSTAQEQCLQTTEQQLREEGFREKGQE